MAIVTRRRADRFTIIPNDVAESGDLSFEARGMLCYLLAKPADWSVNVDDLARAGSIGRDKTYRILNELIGSRYVERIRHRGLSGQITEVEYLVHNEPAAEPQPLPEKPDLAKPYLAEPDLEKPDALIRTQSHQELTREGDAGATDLLGTVPQSKPSSQGCRLPSDFEPDLFVAQREGMSPAEAEREALRFADYWAGVPGKDGRKADWPATWRNWVRRSMDQRHRGRPPTVGRVKPKTVADQALESLMERSGRNVPAIAH